MSVLNKGFKRILGAAAWLSRPATVFYTLPALMLLLFCGTVAQRYIGLYDAQNMFFSSFVLWAGPIPLPAGYSLTAILGLGLSLKFLQFSRWSLQKAGLHLTHLGALVLILGGLLTALQAKEGFVVIPEGQSTAVISDYHQRELVIAIDGMETLRIAHQKLRTGKTLETGQMPFALRVHDTCRNCKIIPREEAQKEYKGTLHGMARFMALTPQQNEKEEEANLSGATISLSGLEEEQNGVYVIFEAMPKPITFEHDGHRYDIIYRKQQRNLPFALHLEKFERQDHPGTRMARAYSSDIIVQDGGVNWPVRIEMNSPLRYKGYTFFQSSFAENAQETATVLSVVKNKGWLFPYLSTAIITIGLLWHVFVTARTRRKEKANKKRSKKS